MVNNIFNIPNFENEYGITVNGKIWSYKNRKWLKQYTSLRGYKRVDLYHKGCKSKHLVHRLVAQTFIPNYEHKLQVNHIDGNKLNNNVENLEWCTNTENINHAKDMNLIKKGELKTTSKLTDKNVIEIKRYLKLNTFTQVELANMYNISRGVISGIKNNRGWTHI